MLFGNSRGECPVNRSYQDIFVEQVLYALGFDGYGIPNNEELCKSLGFVENEHGVCTNGVFSIFPYWWGDCTCGADESDDENATCSDDCKLQFANFVHHPTGFVLRWYKYALRDSYSNIPLTVELLHRFIEDTKATYPPC